jgi:CRP/FNR family transcriptional regulator, cyclic AMP receptor protein
VNAQIRTHPETQVEPLSTRVALHPFLAGMNHTQLTLLTDCTVARHFHTNQQILGEGDFANGFYLVETGRVALESVAGFGESIVIQTIGAGDLLGWSWMFPPYVWQFTARAIKPTTALFFYAAILREYCEKDHSLGYELLKRISAVMVNALAGCA